MKSLIIALLSFLVFAANATQPIVEQFINGSGFVVTNNTAYTYGITSMLVYDHNRTAGLYQGSPDRIFWSQTHSNMVPTVVSNAVSGYAPGTLYWTNYADYDSASPAAGGIIENTNITFGNAWVDVPAFCNADADQGTAVITVSSEGATASATNIVTFVFAPIFNGTNYVTSGPNGAAPLEGVEKLTLLVALTGATATTAKTNVPTAFMQGAQKIRLVSVTTGNQTGALPAKIRYVTLSGYTKP